MKQWGYTWEGVCVRPDGGEASLRLWGDCVWGCRCAGVHVDVRGTCSQPCHRWCQTWWAGCRLWCAQSLPPSGPPAPGWTWPADRLPRYPLEPLLRRGPGLVCSHGSAMEGRDRASRGHHWQRCTRRYAHMSYDSDTTAIMSTEFYIQSVVKCCQPPTPYNVYKDIANKLP